MSHSQRSVTSERNPPSQRSYHDRPRRERYGPNGQPNGERRDQRSHNRLPSRAPVRGQHSRPPTVISERYSRHSKASSLQHSPPAHRSNPEKQTFSEKCSNLCSIRGLLQMVEILINLLVLICAVATESASAGFSSLGAFSSAYYYSMGYSMSGFQGDEVDQVAQLDLQYHRMKLPTIYVAVAISLLLLTLTLSCMAASCMSGAAQNRKLLLAEGVFNVLSAVTYIIFIALYMHFIKQSNATEVCKRRESLYNRHGYNSVTCDIMGTEMAVCVFAVVLVVLYISSAVVVGFMLRAIKMNANIPNPQSLNTEEQKESEMQNLTSESKNKMQENISSGLFI
ncbi:MARVEL domain-containing protein 3-like isoform X1 [Bufo gargarizans]|uniref:MARVEL domain-containing protein 3-like isoform X1 n=1 Tax=Bufo gargarizans TaxID=30331 RepID=UPI001CF39B72|nr:MARVEL domain-containing protein 3-like isoform X1 [Bufo gargarizans]